MSASLEEQPVASTDEPREIAAGWLTAFDAALGAGDATTAADLFLADGWWRDLLALSGDLRSRHGRTAIARGLEHASSAVRPRGFRLEPDKPVTREAPQSGVEWIQALCTFETDIARGRALVRLMPDADGDWRAWTLGTAMEALKGHEEATGHRRPAGVDHGARRNPQNWRERRTAEQTYRDRDPEVLVIGAGQGGLTLGARLKQLGVDTLLVDRNQRVGDNWRQRYHTLVLHDPVWYDHLPYLPFPPNWPVFTPKDKLADWFEHYAETMELNTWMGTDVLGAEYDAGEARWQVRLNRSGKEVTLRPRHVVMATGIHGLPHLPEIPGMDDFRGALVHAADHAGGADWRGRKAVVVGAGNSGHDIAHEFHEYGADTTLVQRSSTCVISSKNGIPALFAGFYEEDGPPTEDADLMFASIPFPLLGELHKDLTRQLAEQDAELLDGLAAAGFKLDFGEDGSGLFMKVLRRGGGYYIDVGCSQLIADGRIGIKQGAEISRITPDGLAFDDGSTLDADIIVFATGYSNMREYARLLMGDTVADQVNPVWGLDEEGELRTIWRDSGHPGLWFMGGNLHLCRHYSRFLALQIKAQEEGIRLA